MAFSNELDEVEAKVKKWWQSMTIWFNTVAPAAALALDQLQGQIPQLQPYVPEHLYRWTLGVVIGGNIIIRLFFTKKAIG